MNSAYNLLSVLNLIVTVAFVLGGYFAFRHGFIRTANEVQERVITALNSEIESLIHRLDELEKENVRLNLVIAAISRSLKRRKINIDIERDMITIRDQDSGATQTERIQEDLERSA